MSISFKEDNKHALRIHLILLNITNELARKSLELQIITNPRYVNVPNSISHFLSDIYGRIDYWRNHSIWRNNPRTKSANCIYFSIEQFLIRNHSRICPEDFEIFDMTAIHSIVRNMLTEVLTVHPNYVPLNGWKDKYQDYHENDNSFAACIDNLHLIRNHFYGHLKIYGITITEYETLIKRLKNLIDQLSFEHSIEKNMEKFCQYEQTLIFTQDQIQEYQEMIKSSHDSIIQLLKEKINDQKSMERINEYNLKTMNGLNRNLNDLLEKLRETDELKMQSILANFFSDKSLKLNQYFAKLEENIVSSIIDELKPIKQDLTDIKAEIKTKKCGMQSNIPPLKKNLFMIENILFDRFCSEIMDFLNA